MGGGIEVQVTFSYTSAALSIVRTLSLPEDDELQQIRWYLERSPLWAGEAERRLAEVGRRAIVQHGSAVWQALFGADAEGRACWAQASDRLAELRVEVMADDDVGLCLDILRESEDDQPLAARVAEWVWVPRRSVSWAPIPVRRGGVLRVLVVVARPRGDMDVPFRSVAAEIVGVTGAAIEVEILRPPTPGRMIQVLRGAAAAGHPFDVLHVDAHGRWEEQRQTTTLMFESERGFEAVDADDIGRAVARSGVRVVVTNACRSGFGSEAGPGSPSLIRRLSSFGVPAVVGMRVDAFASTAATMARALYRALGNGASAGEAVAQARRELHAVAATTGGAGFDDWLVPLVIERRRFARAESPLAPPVEPRRSTSSIGVDRTLLAMDRAFDRASVVLLWGLCGSGRTTAAHEAAGWFVATGRFQRVFWFQRSSGRSATEVFSSVVDEGADPTRVLWIVDDLDDANAPLITSAIRHLGARHCRFLLVARDAGAAPSGASVVGMRPLAPEDAASCLRAWAEPGLSAPRGGAWAPAVAASDGNPLMLRCLMKEAQGPVASIRAAVEGWSASAESAEPVMASLGRGAAGRLEEGDLRLLAPLQLYRGFASSGSVIDVARRLSGSAWDGGLPIHQALRRAACAGWVAAVEGDLLQIHPALPALIERQHPADVAMNRVFVAVMGDVANMLADRYRQGQRSEPVRLGRHERTLLRARRMAIGLGEPVHAIRLMQGLRFLYEHHIRYAEWAELVEEMRPLYERPDDHRPLPGLAQEWMLLAEYRIGVADRVGADTLVMDLATRTVEVGRERVAAAAPPAEHEREGLALSLITLGNLRERRGLPGGQEALREAMEVCPTRLSAALRPILLYNLARPTSANAEQSLDVAREALLARPQTDRLGRSYSHCLVADLLRMNHERLLRDNHPARSSVRGEAEPHYQAAVELAGNHHQAAGAALFGWGLLLALEGDRGYVDLLRAAIDRYDQAQCPDLMADAATKLAFNQLLDDCRDEAEAYAATALSAWQRASRPSLRGIITARSVMDMVTARRASTPAVLIHQELEQAFALASEGEHEQAITRFRAIVERAPEVVEARYDLGKALQLAGRSAEALVAWRSCLEREPGLIQVRWELAGELREQKRWAEAMDALRELFTIEEPAVDRRFEERYAVPVTLSWALRDVAVIYGELGRHGLAAAVARSALADPAVHRGEDERLRGVCDIAADRAPDPARRKPGPVTWLLASAGSILHAGDPEAALDLYRQIRGRSGERLPPLDRWNLEMGLAVALDRLGDPGGAAPHLALAEEAAWSLGVGMAQEARRCRILVAARMGDRAAGTLMDELLWIDFITACDPQRRTPEPASAGLRAEAPSLRDHPLLIAGPHGRYVRAKRYQRRW